MTLLNEIGNKTDDGSKVLRQKALEAVKVKVAREVQIAREGSELNKMAVEWCREFSIPRAGTAIDWSKSSVAAELNVINKLKPVYRKPRTWLRLLPTWRKVSKYLQEKMELDKIEYNVANVVEYGNEYVAAAMVIAYQTSSAMAAVSIVSQAVKMALAMSGFNPKDWKPQNMCLMMRACALERSKEPGKAFAVTVEQARQIHVTWGIKSESLVDRMASAAFVIMFLKLLRFADMCLICTGGIYWMGFSGFAFALVGEKNDAACIGRWKTVADTGEEGCFARCFRKLVSFLCPNVTVPPPDAWGFAKGASEFVFKRGAPKEGANKSTHRHMRREVEIVVGNGGEPINAGTGSAAYDWYLKKLRTAMHECCGMRKPAAEKIVTHSLKRGGNTGMMKAGASKRYRIRAGGWADEQMDDEYLQFCIDEDMQYAKEFSV